MLLEKYSKIRIKTKFGEVKCHGKHFIKNYDYRSIAKKYSDTLNYILNGKSL